MLVALPFALAALVAVVAWGIGGYAPWAGLALELGAFALFAWLVVAVLLGTTPEARRRYLALAKRQSRQSEDVEIVTPSRSASEQPFREPYYVLGFPFRRMGASLWIGLLTLWAAASLVPLPPALLSILSPKAFALREQAAALAGRSLGWVPTSTTPFLTLQDLLLWAAYLLLFVVAYHVSDSSRAVRRLSVALLLVGAASGVFGVVQWLTALSQGGTEGLVATGSFGNRNHYAYFQEMLALVAAGYLAFRWARADRRSRDRREAQEAKARAALLSVLVGAAGLGLLLSVSRSGIVCGVVGLATLAALCRDRSSTSTRRGLVFALALVAVVLWIGIDPVLERFHVAPGDLADEEGRTAVWKDTLGAVPDFWLTGSGLSSFSYVYPIYRSFGGRRFFSWAHNDYLQLALELGAPGLLLALGLAVWIVRRARKVRARLAEDPAMQRLQAGYLAALLAVALHSFTDFGLHLPANAALFAVVAGVATGMSPSRRRRVARPATASG